MYFKNDVLSYGYVGKKRVNFHSSDSLLSRNKVLVPECRFSKALRYVGDGSGADNQL